MPRKCSICTHADREVMEGQLAEGMTFSAVSRESRNQSISPDALERHWNNHVVPEMKVALWSEGVPGLSLAWRILSMDSDASTIRKRALVAGDDRTALNAIKTSASLLTLAMERLGVERADTQRYLEEAQMLFTVIVGIVRENPRAVSLFTERLPPEGGTLKNSLDRIAEAAMIKAKEEGEESISL